MAKAGKARKAKRRAKSAVGPAVATGPVTLEEARALAKAKLATRPKGAKAVARKAVAPRATHATVGAERKKLREKQRREIDVRIEEYKATIAIMKKRGARKARPKAKGKTAAKKVAKGSGAPQAFAPLQILAEGDSWFDYPFTHVLKSLEDEHGYVNVIVSKDMVEKNEEVVKRAPFVLVQGRVENDGSAISVVGRRFRELEVGALTHRSHNFR